MPNVSTQNAPVPFSIPGLELQEKIGEGGMSTVYRAVHTHLQRTVAVKIVKSTTDEGTAAPTWLRESRLMAALAHPHVVAIHDAGQAAGSNYLVMEHMAGGSLRSRLDPGQPWPLARAAPVLDCIARALQHIHDRGVLHLDLKPENVLYSADGEVKISDFGLSAPGTTAAAHFGGAFRGTLDYCSPEQRAGLSLDGRSDVFSLATLAYELLTGRLPGRVYLPPTRRNPRLPGAIDEVLRRGLARVPEERYRSVSEFRQALDGACRRPRSRFPVWVTAALGIMAVLLTAVLVLGKWRAPRSPSGLPSRLWLLYERPDDLTLLGGENGQRLTSGLEAAVERVQVENTGQPIPAELPLSNWPAPRPVLVVHSQGAWGFVHPLLDHTLGRRVVRNWSALARAAVPPERNLAKAGGFDGECLATSDTGKLWRVTDATDWGPTRGITLDRPSDQPDDPALLLTLTEQLPSKKPLNCYQPLTDVPPPGAVLVLRFRAKSRDGKGSLSVHPGMTVVVPDEKNDSAASRIRSLGLSLPPEPGKPASNRWWYRSLTWVTPATDWQTYVIVFETPADPFRVLYRDLGIELAGAGQVLVDDVELFVWQPEVQP